MPNRQCHELASRHFGLQLDQGVRLFRKMSDRSLSARHFAAYASSRQDSGKRHEAKDDDMNWLVVVYLAGVLACLVPT